MPEKAHGISDQITMILMICTPALSNLLLPSYGITQHTGSILITLIRIEADRFLHDAPTSL